MPVKQTHASELLQFDNDLRAWFRLFDNVWWSATEEAAYSGHWFWRGGKPEKEQAGRVAGEQLWRALATWAYRKGEVEA